MEWKQKQVLITMWILGNLECLRSVADRFKITKSILFCVYRGICGAIANHLPGQYMKYLLVWNWAPLSEMINFGSSAQRNALDQWSNESLSRVDLIDHWSENGFARKERHRSEILIRILPKERTLKVEIYCFICWSCLDKVRRFFYHFTLLHTSLTILPTTSSNVEFCFDFVVNTEMSVSLR